MTRHRKPAAAWLAALLMVTGTPAMAPASDAPSDRLTQVKLSHIQTNGIRMRVAQQGQGPVVLLLHGFPSVWYAWRHQLPALASAGYHAVAPDMRGFGGSDAPPGLEDYDILDVCGDISGLLDSLGAKQVYLVGHDWGGVVAWVYALLHPERVQGLVSLSTPWQPRSPVPPMAALQAASGDNFFYMVYFQTPGVAEAELDSRARDVLTRLLVSPSTPTEPPRITDAKARAGGLLDRLAVPKALPPWLSQNDLDYFVTAFERTGFRGGINYYRNIDRSWELTPQLEGATVQAPVLYIAGAQDPVLAGRDRAAIEGPMRLVGPGLTAVHLLPDTGHWVQMERAAEVNKLILAFLKSVDQKKP